MNKKGFSLIELLTVLAIIGILLGLGMQTYSKTRINTQARLERHSLLQLPLALETHFNKHQTYPASLISVWEYQTDGIFYTPKKYYYIQYNLNTEHNYTIKARLNPEKSKTKQLICSQLTLQSNGELIALNSESLEITEQCW